MQAIFMQAIVFFMQAIFMQAIVLKSSFAFFF